MRPQWNEVAALSRAAAPFSFHEWFDAAWQWRQRTSRLYLLALFDDERLAAVLPLVVEQVPKWGMRRRELSFLTVPDTQACDMIVSEPLREGAAKCFADELRRRQDEWDVIRLNYLLPESATATSFRDALTRIGFTTHLQQASGNWFLRVDSDWETYYATRSRRLKKASNLAANRLKKVGSVHIEQLVPGTGTSSDVDRFLDQVVDISARSWKKRTGNSLDNPGPQSFIRRLSHLAHERGWLSIWTLSVNERPLAMEYQLIADARIYALRSDFDAEFEEHSPGTHLNRYLVERLFGVGLERYYMGPGENAYKLRWTEQVEPLEALTVYGCTPAGRWLAVWDIAFKPRVRKIRDRLWARANDEAKADAG